MGETSPVERVLRPPLPRIHLFDEEVRVLLRRRLMHLHLVFAAFLLLLVPYAFTGIGEGMAYGASKTLATALGVGLFFYVDAMRSFSGGPRACGCGTWCRLELALFGGLMLTMGGAPAGRLSGVLRGIPGPEVGKGRGGTDRYYFDRAVLFCPCFLRRVHSEHPPPQPLGRAAFATIPLVVLARRPRGTRHFASSSPPSSP